MSFSLQDQQRVFLAYRALFEGSNAQLRKQKKIKQLAQSHKKSSKTLVQALGLDRIVIILKHLLERGIFESESRARKAFPLLFQTTAKQNAQHSALEIGAANLEAQALEGAEAMDQINCDRDDEDEDLGDDEDLFDKYRPHEPQEKASHSCSVPSLYPAYIPYRTQHLILTAAQRLLEECCFHFTMKWSPSLIKQKHWDCPEAIELNNWTHTMKSHHQKLPPNAFRDNSPSAVPAALVSVNALRHSAVHRLHTSAKGISEMVHSAAAFADLLGDTSRQLQLEELHRELESKLRAQELHKNYLETRINQEFDEIGALREALDKREKEAVATFLKEDRENQFIIGSLLEDSVRETLPKEKGLEIGVDPVRQGVDPEDEAGVIELEKDYPSDMGDVPEGLPLGKAEEYDSSPSKELLLGALSAEELSDKERPVEDQPAEEPSAGEPEPDVQQWELPELRESSPEKIEKGFSDMELPAHTTEESLHEAPENEWINRPASGIQLAESIPLEEEPADEPQATKMYDVVDDSVQAEQESPLETEVLQEIVGTDDPHVRTDLGCSIVHMLDENDQIVRDEIRSLFLD